jgi:hypothetical protein
MEAGATASAELAVIALDSNVVCMKPNARWLIAAVPVALGGCGHSGLPATPLFVGVEGTSYSQGSRLIQDRLQARFPTGSSERKLRAYLKQQGLQVARTALSSTSRGGAASFKYGSSLCGSRVRVSWESDAAGKIESIDGSYSDTGCP